MHSALNTWLHRWPTRRPSRSLSTAGLLAALALASPVAPAATGVGAGTSGGTAATPLAGAQTLGPAGEGRRLYLKLNCYSCHGMTPTGGMGPNIVHAEQGDVTEAVMQGEDGGMRAYKAYVTATDLTNLGAYLRSIGTTSEPKFRDWWVPVPTK